MADNAVLDRLITHISRTNVITDRFAKNVSAMTYAIISTQPHVPPEIYINLITALSQYASTLAQYGENTIDVHRDIMDLVSSLPASPIK